MNQSPRAIFVSVKTNQQKILAICTIAEEYFQKEKPLLIAVANDVSARYVDELLWRVPYFLPHSIITSEKPVLLAIAINPESNLNNGTALLNLSAHVLPIASNFPIVYELFDETADERLEKSNQRLAYYRQNSWQIMLPEQGDQS
jgi:DNA polymerase IIIc chi subunit